MNSAQSSRLSRMKTQPLYLIDQIKEDKIVEFTISGSTANLYQVKIDPENLSCNCPDMSSWARDAGVKCKHCCFVWVKILRLPTEWLENNSLIDQSKVQEAIQNQEVRAELINTSYQEKYRQLQQQKNKTNKETGKEIDTGKETVCSDKFAVTKELIEDDCPICFDQLEATDSLQCPTCSNLVHQKCIRKWLSTGHQNCVYCRSDWSELITKKKKKSKKIKYINLLQSIET